jgi:hypothetical protein
MRSKSGAIGNRPIDNLIEQKHAYEILKARNAKIRANNVCGLSSVDSRNISYHRHHRSRK